MNSSYIGTANALDHIRRSRGVVACRNMFGKLGKEHRQTAIRLINDSRLFFISLFVLQPEIEELNLREELSERNRMALNICEKILNEKKLSGNSDYLISLNSEEVHRVLLWMFNTGADYDGLNNEFDQILDIVASILIKTHHEKMILPLMIDMIFKRNRKGRYIHDLVWACFQTRDENALRFIAGYLRSSDSKDVDLVRTLLHLPQDVPLRTKFDKQKQYVAYLSWLKENNSYLYFTDESLQFTNRPSPCGVNLAAKYLCKNNGMSDRKQITPLTDVECSNLVNFNQVPENEQTILAKHSQRLHGENPSYWNQWMQYPVDKQIQIAQYGRRRFL